jgi:hypothetical protein
MFEQANAILSKKLKLIGILFIPWIFSLIFKASPVTSYLIAWTGSFFILYCSILSPMRLVSDNETPGNRIMRPVVLLQVVFAGFMCCTSVFHFMDHLGYEFLTDVNAGNFVVDDKTYSIADCQRYYVLGHASLVAGIVVASKSAINIKYTWNLSTNRALTLICMVSQLAIFLFKLLPALAQLALLLTWLVQFSGTSILARGLKLKDIKLALLGFAVFMYHLIQNTLSGYKEGVIVSVLILLGMLFPYYKRLVSIISIPVMCLLIYALPTLAGMIRSEAWDGQSTAVQARNDAIHTLFSPDPGTEIRTNNWNFLKDRFNEIGMFSEYTRFVPDQHDYLGFDILWNSLISLVPRVLWANKPDTEKISMERVYASGAVNRLSDVSAKTRPVVDGYLSGGIIGVVMVLFLYGLIAQNLSNTAERYFGGYSIGCTVVFNGLFQQLWRGNNMEFLLNNILYGYILMMLIFHILKGLQILRLSNGSDFGSSSH